MWSYIVQSPLRYIHITMFRPSFLQLFPSQRFAAQWHQICGTSPYIQHVNYNAYSTVPTSTSQPITDSNRPRDGEETAERDVLYKKIVLTVKGHEPEVLQSYQSFVQEVCENLALDLHCDTRNRPTFKRLSLNKSPFIYKKHQRQYEFRTYYKYFTISRITGCTADVFLEYVQRNLPEGVAMECTRHRLEKLPEAIVSKTTQPQ
ncbi:28S ribosomal protein S10, mitochondrial [Clonorchis sinensis]|uniref:Small ribosomal subunit protein uS10m n=1 Tax=Clonorchis sinensis TaxID=79923 RepID=A0A8T1M0I9_CLOSI|nr:28S ribosomal protein S10, mitochondrial [Clonorchis sinensis]